MAVVRIDLFGNLSQQPILDPVLKGDVVSQVINLRAAIGFAGSGSYRRPIPTTQTPGSDYCIRITGTTNNPITDDSNANLTIR